MRTRLINQAGRSVAAVLLTLAGCGYHFSATDTSGIPSDVTTIYVAHFDNHTRINGINEQLLLELKQEISNHKRLVLVDNPTGADLTLSGDVSQDTMLPTTFNSVSEPTQYTETLAVDAVLRNNKTNQVLWQTSHLKDSGSYATVAQAVIPTSPEFLQGNLRGVDIKNMTDIQVAQSQQFLSRDQMLQRISRSIYSSMVQGF